MAIDDEPGFDPRELYDQFPAGAEEGFGPEEGFNRWVRINDERLFTEEARRDPVVHAFLEAPFTVNYAQFKSSVRESEYFIHLPVEAMTGRVDGIEGRVENMPQDTKMATLVMNHHNSLAKLITRSMVIEDGQDAGQLIHKQPPQEEG
ncbi:MAG TPA: hypothetical protein VMP67_08070 [Candidatus Limnocylindria bacterium]|nr:hypothetical protein [Candidatus Limnocylindria bacterium]